MDRELTEDEKAFIERISQQTLVKKEVDSEKTFSEKFMKKDKKPKKKEKHYIRNAVVIFFSFSFLAIVALAGITQANAFIVDNINVLSDTGVLEVAPSEIAAQGNNTVEILSATYASRNVITFGIIIIGLLVSLLIGSKAFKFRRNEYEDEK